MLFACASRAMKTLVLANKFRRLLLERFVFRRKLSIHRQVIGRLRCGHACYESNPKTGQLSTRRLDAARFAAAPEAER